MLKSILFPVIKKPITLKHTITGIAKIQTVLPRCVVDIVVGGEIVVFQNVF